MKRKNKIALLRKKTMNIAGIFGICILGMMLGMSGLIQNVNADWSPETNEIAPINDAYVSISGSLAEPQSNYGGSNSLEIGNGLDGHCVSAIEFNLTSIPNDTRSLEFLSDVTVYGEETRMLKVSIILDTQWDELEVTGLNNPFNATDFWMAPADYANLTSIQIVGSSSEISINLTEFMDQDRITLVLATSPEDGSWIDMSSKESEYLYSTSNPPHLKFDLPEDEDSNNGGQSEPGTDDSDGGSDIGPDAEEIPGFQIGWISLISFGAIGLVAIKIRKSINA